MKTSTSKNSNNETHLLSFSRLNVERKINKAMQQLPNPNTNTSLSSYTSQKIQNLQRFLDNAENTTPLSQSNNFSLGSAPLQESILLDQLLKESQQISDCQNVNLLKIELNEAQKTIESLKGFLENEQMKYNELEKKSQNELEKKMETQKEELETVINRHLGFIDQLISDKTSLNNEIEGLLKKIKSLEESYEKTINDMKETHNKEMKGQKDQILAGEKTKKEKWMCEKLQEIKNMTIKGLEPELESLMNKHKKDLKKFEDQQEKELKIIKASLQETYEKDLLEMRKRLIFEYEESYQKNRDVEYNKLKEAYCRLEKEGADEREFIKKSRYKEIENMEKGRKEQMEEYLKNLKRAQEIHLEELKKEKIEFQGSLDKIKQELQKEKDEYQKKILADQESWKESKLNELKENFNLKAIELEAQMQKDRDQQIELIISRLSEESENVEKSAFDKYQKKLSEVSSSKSNETSTLQRKVKVLESQQEALKKQIETLIQEKNALENEKNNMKSSFITKEKETAEMLIELQKLRSQTVVSDEIIGSLERNFTKRTEKERENHERKIDEIRKEIGDLKMVQYKEMEELSEKQGKELENMEERVRKVVQRKENEIVRLGEELKQKGMEIEKYKEMLEKQRRDLMKGNKG